MWKLLADYAKRIAFLTQDTQKNKADIKVLQDQVQDLTDEIRQMNFESRRDRENAAHEHEKLLLRLEITLLRSGRGLPVRSDSGLLLEEPDENRPPGP